MMHTVGIKVKVHPHRTRVNSGIAKCVSVTPDRPGGRARYYGYVYLENASFRIHKSGVERARQEQRRNVHAWCVGELKSYRHEQLPVAQKVAWLDNGDWEQVTYHYNIGRFVTLDGRDVTDEQFSAAICNGRDFYVKVR